MEHKFIRCGLSSCRSLMRYIGSREALYCMRCRKDRAHIPIRSGGGNLNIDRIQPIGSIGFARA